MCNGSVFEKDDTDDDKEDEDEKENTSRPRVGLDARHDEQHLDKAKDIKLQLDGA